MKTLVSFLRGAAAVALLVFLHPATLVPQGTNLSVTINLAGPNSGRVGIVPTGTLCDHPNVPSCTVSIPAGTAVTIVANGAAGGGPPGVFSAGTGSASACGTTTCTFTLTANSTVTATFDLALGPFVVMSTVLAGDGQGEVGADNSRRQNYDPATFSATGTTYAVGSVVNLGATPTPESRFSGYSNGTSGAAACGAAPKCSFPITAAATITATFHALTAIAVQPSTAAMFVGGGQQFSARGTFTNGVIEALPPNGMGVWRTRAQAPTARFSLSAAAASGRIYAIGGIVGQVPGGPSGAPSNLVEAFDPVANTWAAAAAMATPREGAGVATIGNLIYAVGGNTSGSVPTAAVERYDPATNTWTARAPLPAARRFLTAVALNGVLYAIGGNTGGAAVATVESYDPATNTWAARASMLAPRTGPIAAAGDGVLYVTGGTSGPSVDAVEMYDPATDAWTARTRVPNGRPTAAAAAADGVIYSFGDRSNSGATAYDAVNDLWANKSQMPTSRGQFATATLNGIVYAIGGQANDNSSLKTIEAFTDALRWRSSNRAAAAIRQDGRALGIAAGDADIVATIGGLACAGASCGTVSVARSTNTMALDHPSLQFGATTNGIALINTTPPQQVRMTQSGAGTVTWTAVSSRPWLIVSPASGTGATIFRVSVVSDPSVPASGTIAGAVSIQLTGADAAVGPINVALAVQPTGASAAPFGAIDTPLEGDTGVVGSIPVTGWALDDLGVSQVRITRRAVAGEPAGSEIFLGFANIVEGARPDVATSFPGAPKGTAAGWGYLLLTNFLPGQGNGTFRLSAYADDVDGHSTLLGSRTITCANSAATTPFGAIDTPGQGDTVTGTVNNFGWVLSPGTRRADPTSGGVVNVFIDGAPVGVPGGWTARPDLAALFPAAQYAGVTNALGVFTFDSTVLSNGVHTIAWGVLDNQSGAAGVGSRYFTASNGGAMRADPGRPDDRRDDGAPLLRSEAPAAEAQAVTQAAHMLGRRGFGLDTPLRPYFAGADGVITIQSEEIDRIELRPGAGTTGALRAGGALRPLPIGASIEPASGVFTWQPGPGFVGAYDFVLTTAGIRRDLRIVLNPKHSNRVGPQIVIDRSDPDVAGWAIDLDAPIGSGVDTVHVWAYPVSGAAPIFLGAADYGGARPDVAAIYGGRFLRSGYGLRLEGLVEGTYDLAVFAYSSVTGGFVPAKTVRVTVR